MGVHVKTAEVLVDSIDRCEAAVSPILKSKCQTNLIWTAPATSYAAVPYTACWAWVVVSSVDDGMLVRLIVVRRYGQLSSFYNLDSWLCQMMMS